MNSLLWNHTETAKTEGNPTARLYLAIVCFFFSEKNATTLLFSVISVPMLMWEPCYLYSDGIVLVSFCICGNNPEWTV